MSTGLPSAEQRIKNGANWFYWIAALSVVNSISSATGSDWGFIVGLGATQVVDAIGRSVASGLATGVALAFDVAVAGLVAITGLFARRVKAVYVLGMVLYALDGLIFLVVSDWIGLGFHVFVVLTMIPGIKAFGELRAAAAAPPAAGTAPAPAELPPLPVAVDVPEPVPPALTGARPAG